MLIYLLKVILSNVLSIELSNNLICIQGGRDIKNKRADIKNTLIDLSNNKLNKKHNLFTVDINRMFYGDGINDRINDVTNYVNNFKNDDLFYYGTKITPYLLLNSYFDKLFKSGTIDRVNNVIVSVRDYYDDEIYKKIVGSFDNLNAMVVPESTSAAIFKSNSLSLKEFCILNFRGEKVIKSEFNLDNKKLELVKRTEIVSEVNDALIDKLITDLIIKSLKKTNSSVKCIPYDKLEYGYKFTDIKEIKDNVLLKIGQGNTEYTHGYIELFKLNKNKNDEIEISKVAAISELKLDLKPIIDIINSVDINSMVDGRDTFIISDYISSKNDKVSNIDIGEICWGNTFISKFDVKDEKICKEVDICKSIIDFKSKKFIIEKARSKLLKFKDSDFKYFSKENSLDEFKELLEKNREDILDKRILKKVFDSSYEFNKKYDEIKKINNDI
ncbi:hypothetical protein A0H76_2360 [Hepatospora eriocheir]|uniref:Uncharacterized protein n=1 Tax=Hepatospora eriocheir TaxID=1081669 RepID=A0A1X0QJW1_9MICR|nr:hypothetical protein A0H76_2360 [Hepatospora eriocheir]